MHLLPKPCKCMMGAIDRRNNHLCGDPYCCDDCGQCVVSEYRKAVEPLNLMQCNLYRLHGIVEATIINGGPFITTTLPGEVQTVFDLVEELKESYRVSIMNPLRIGEQG